MAMKVCSGVLVIRGKNREGGNATVSFVNNSLTGDAELWQAQMIGAETRMTGTPCRIVALRQVVVHESADRVKRAISNAVDPLTQREKDGLIIDTQVNRDTLSIFWRTEDSSGASRSEISEISYMVVGET